MIINFQSIINNGGKIKKIEFASTVTISKFQDFDVYEFREPSKNEMNRIEIAKNKINIISGPSTMELEMNKKIKIIYKDSKDHKLIFESLLYKLIRNSKSIFFEYCLFNQNNLIGKYKITLIIKNLHK